MGIAEMFEGMDTSHGSSSGVFFTNGNYDVELKEIEFRPNGYKGKSVIFYFKTLKTNNPEHPAGATRVWILKPFDGTPDQKKRAMADIKDLVFALTGTTKKEVGSPEQNPAAHQQATSLFLAAIDKEYAAKKNLDADALIGQSCQLECQQVPTKPSQKNPNGGEYSRHIWTPSAE